MGRGRAWITALGGVTHHPHLGESHFLGRSVIAHNRADRGEDEVARDCSYWSSPPISLPVFRLIKWTFAQAGQSTPSYSSSGTSFPLPSQCWMLSLVSGQMKSIGRPIDAVPQAEEHSLCFRMNLFSPMMPDIKECWCTTCQASPSDPGQVEIGFYFIENGVLKMCDESSGGKDRQLPPRLGRSYFVSGRLRMT